MRSGNTHVNDGEAQASIVGQDGTRIALRVELATSPSARQTGLSGRERVPDGTGMLFSCPGPFWMKDCLVPLDVAFLASDGTILSIANMPVCTRPAAWQPRYEDPSGKCVAALETRSGWFSDNGISAGAMVTLDAGGTE